MLTARALACGLACAFASLAGGQQAPPPQSQSIDTSAPEVIIVSPSAKELEVGRPRLNVSVVVASVTEEIVVKYALNGGAPAGERKGVRNTTITFQVQLTPGTNSITVIAENGRKSSAPVTLRVNYVPRKSFNDDLLFLGVGVSDYRDAAMKAAHAESDVRDLAALFKTQEDGSVFDNVDHLLIAGQEATRAALIKGLVWVEDKADEPEDVALVYVSGQFSPATLGKGNVYFLTPQHEPGSDPEYNDLSVDIIMRRLATVKGRVFLLLEHAGAAGKPPDPYLAHKVISSAPRNIAACMAFHEGAAAGAPARERGALAEALVAGLRGRADSNGDRAVDVEELQSWLNQRGKEGGGFGVACSWPAGSRPLAIFAAGGSR